MIKCGICSKEFKTRFGLSIHLSGKKSCTTLSIKEYYDNYLRKENEGYCQFCNIETSFSGLVKGYINNTCNKCTNLKKETQLKRQLNKKIKNEDKEIICQICEKGFDNLNQLSKHIKIHKLKPKEYYDKYLRKENEGICLITNKETKFKNLVEGYYKYSGKGINSKSNEVKIKKEKTIQKKYNVKNTFLLKSSKDKVKKIKNKNQNKKYNRILLIDILRKLSIDKNNIDQCQICGRLFDNTNSLIRHIKIHNLKLKKYYDLFFKKHDEGKCLISGLNTQFDSLKNGYRKYHKKYCQQSEEVINKIKEGQLQQLIQRIIKYQDYFNVKIFTDQITKVTDHVDILCCKCNQIYQHSWYNIQLGYGKCPNCYSKNSYVSSYENELKEFLLTKFKEEEILTSYRGLIQNDNNRWLELDIYIPDKKVAIEFNGLYWHSENILKDPMNYHLDKTNKCLDKNVQLIHIFEDEWVLKKDIIKNVIIQKLGINNTKRIHARKCEIKEIDVKTKNIFLDNYHLQGQDKSNIKLGAFYNNELIAVMTFGYGNITRGGNPNNKLIFELTRFATNHSYHIPGIASKLLSYFKRNYDWEQIFSYADRRWSQGNLYHKLGFELQHKTKPDYWYVDGINRIHRYNLRKTINDPKDVPEWVLRQNEGYYRIWDCGKIKFVIKK